MTLTASMRLVATLGCLCAIACSAEAPQMGRRQTTTSPATNAGSGGAGGSTPGYQEPPPYKPPVSGSGASAAVGGSSGADAPAAGSGGAAGSGTGGDGCEEGKYCAPVEPDSDNCGKIELKTDVKTVLKPGNVMVVFDRSSSMEADWNGAAKFKKAGDALIAAIDPLKDNLKIGGVFFPSVGGVDMNCPNGCNPIDALHWIPGPGACCLNGVAQQCNVSTIDQKDQINFGPAPDFIAGLPMQWNLPGANGTPLEAGVTRAAEAIAANKFTDPLLVIIMTDGEPNCGTDANRVLTQVQTWKAAGISTHVIGLPGAQGAADLLNRLADAGGTMKYIDPADPAELETRLRAVISSTVRAGFESCSFQLDQKTEVPEKLHLIVTQNGKESDVPRMISKDSGWKVNDEGDQVELQGQLCDSAKDGSFEGLRFVFGCVDVPPYVPPEIF